MTIRVARLRRANVACTAHDPSAARLADRRLVNRQRQRFNCADCSKAKGHFSRRVRRRLVKTRQSGESFRERVSIGDAVGVLIESLQGLPMFRVLFKQRTDQDARVDESHRS